MSQKGEEIELCFTGAEVHLAVKGTNFGGGPEVRECEGPKVRKSGSPYDHLEGLRAR